MDAQPLFYDLSQGWPVEGLTADAAHREDLRIKPSLPEAAKVRRPPPHRRPKEVEEPIISLPDTDETLATDRSIKPSLPPAAIVKRRPHSARGHHRRPPPAPPPKVDFNEVPFSVWAVDNLWATGGVRRRTPLRPAADIPLPDPSAEILAPGPARGAYAARPKYGPGSGMGEWYMGAGGEQPFSSGRFQGRKPEGDAAAAVRPGSYRKPPQHPKRGTRSAEEVRAAALARQRSERHELRRLTALTEARKVATAAERVAAHAQRIAEQRARVVDTILAEQRKHQVFCVARGICPCPHEGRLHLFDERASARVVQQAVEAKVAAAQAAEDARVATAELAQLFVAGAAERGGGGGGGGGGGVQWRSRRLESRERVGGDENVAPLARPIAAGAASLMTADMAAMARAERGTEGFEVEADANFLEAKNAVGRSADSVEDWVEGGAASGADAVGDHTDNEAGARPSSERSSSPAGLHRGSPAPSGAAPPADRGGDGSSSARSAKSAPSQSSRTSRRSSRQPSREPSRPSSRQVSPPAPPPGSRPSSRQVSRPASRQQSRRDSSTPASRPGSRPESRPESQAASRRGSTRGSGAATPDGERPEPAGGAPGEDEQRAACVVQAHRRGQQARGDVAQRRTAKEKVAAEENAAASKLQSHQRGATSRRKVAEQKQQQQREAKAATTVQTHQRGRRAKTETATRRSKSPPVGRGASAAEVERAEKEMERAAAEQHEQLVSAAIIQEAMGVRDPDEPMPDQQPAYRSPEDVNAYIREKNRQRRRNESDAINAKIAQSTERRQAQAMQREAEKKAVRMAEARLINERVHKR